MLQATHNESLVRAAFERWSGGDIQALFAIVADDVRWTITGSCPVSGTFHGKQDFIARAAAPVFQRLATPITPRLRSLVGYEHGAILLWDGEAETKDGARYHNEFCWVFRIENDKVVECTAYFCTVAASALFEAGPKGAN